MPVAESFSTQRSPGTIAICGNPNCGKTTIFNAITGLNQKVANYPGVTVERVTGEFTLDKAGGKRHRIIDVPGTYSLAAFSPDESIAVSVLSGEFDGPGDDLSNARSAAAEYGPDVIIVVIDATNLERSLYLLLQVAEIGTPVVVALNMIDLARKQGIEIDHQLLSERLHGIPVIPVVGNKRQGIGALKKAAVDLIGGANCPRQMSYGPQVETAIDRLSAYGRIEGNNGNFNRVPVIRALFDIDGQAEQALIGRNGGSVADDLKHFRTVVTGEAGSLSAGETGPLTRHAGLLASEVTRKIRSSKNMSERIDKFVLHPLLGPIIMMLAMLLLFQSIFSLAQPFMEIIDSGFSFLADLVRSSMSAGPLRSLLADGVIGGVGSVLIFIPQITILFIFISILEDSGYMARAAFLVDRMFSWCGLSGKSFIPLISSFACAIPGIMAARIIEDRRQRIITIMVAPLMTCSARLPVYAIFIAAFVPYQAVMGPLNLQGLVLASLYLLGMAVAVVVSFVLKKSFLRSHKGTFLMELPSYKVPTLRSTFIRVTNRLKKFVVRAGTVILAITIIIWALSYYPHVDSSQSASLPVAEETASVVSADRSLGNNVLPESKNESTGFQLRNSYLGRAGRSIEPFFSPLGWDWRITVAVLASFPAREVIIATLGTIYNVGSDVDETSRSLMEKMQQARWESGDKVGQPVFTTSVALSIMIFFALCCQCGATVVTIKQETAAWRYAIGTFVYMTTLAYLFAWGAYQIGSRLGI